MEPEELARLIASAYRHKSLVRRFGNGETTEELTRELEGTIISAAGITDLASLVLSFNDSTVTDEGTTDGAITVYGDLGFTDREVFRRASGDWEKMPWFQGSRKTLRFMVQRPGKTFSTKEIKSVTGWDISVSSIQASCSEALRWLPKYSEVYTPVKEGRSPTRYGVIKKI